MTEDEINAKLFADGLAAGREAASKYDASTWVMLRRGFAQLHEIAFTDPPALVYPKLMLAIGLLSVAARKSLTEMDSTKVASA